MPGMNSGLDVSDPTVVAAFKAALLHQAVVALLIFAVLGLTWLGTRAWLRSAARDGAASQAPGARAPGARAPGARAPGARAPGARAPVPAEPAGRRLLRIGFGLLWVFDGVLQAQPKMAVGLPSHIIEPIAASSPAWVQHVVSWAGTTWSYHPVQAAAAAVWIQAGIGTWMLVAARGAWSRLAGLASLGWGLVVWVFGESFGGIFVPGLTWLTGAPGAALGYAVAGALIGLPERAWRTARPGRLILAGMGLFLAGMAVLQAWPGRGFWQGTSHGQPGALTGMVQSMATTPQPRLLSAWVSGFGSFNAAHGFAVNVVVVAALALTGAVFLSGRPRLIRPALVACTLLCLADWVLIQDLGFFGGLGTDPSSMLPVVLLAVAGYLALARVPAAAEPARTGPRPRWRDRLRPAADGFRSVAAAGAVGVIILGAAPMAAAQASPAADPILAQAIGGSSAPVDYPAPPFRLTDQHGRPVSLAGLRGKVVLLTFLDDSSAADSPVIAHEFRQAGQLLGADSRKVELVAINDNPSYTQAGYIQAFDDRAGLAGVPDWLYLTGARAQLQQVWRRYGVAPADFLPAGAMIGPGYQAFVIDQAGHLRQKLGFDTGPGTQAMKSSFAAELAGAAQQLLARR